MSEDTPGDVLPENTFDLRIQITAAAAVGRGTATDDRVYPGEEEAD